MKKLYVTVVSAFALSGCVSMLPHYRYSDDFIGKQGRNMSAVVTCGDRGWVDQSLVYEYAHAVSELLSVSVYNEAVYSGAYKQGMAELATSIPDTFKHLCDRFAAEAPEMTATVRRQYAELRRDRQAALIGMTQSLSSIGAGTGQTLRYLPAPAPVAPVTFGVKQVTTGPHHFLVNSGSGMLRCSVSDSGIVICN